MRLSSGLIFISTIFIFGCGADHSFKQTRAGKALYSCVSGDGELSVTSVDGNRVEAHIVKGNKDVRIQFDVNASIGQAKLVAADVAGEKDLSKFSFMLTLEQMCSGELAAQILPDEYNSLRTLKNFMR